MTDPWAASSHIMESRAMVEDFMLFLGRCVWAPGQLQSELDKASHHREVLFECQGYWDMVATDTEVRQTRNSTLL